MYYRQRLIDHSKQSERLRQLLVAKNLLKATDSAATYSYQELRKLYYEATDLAPKKMLEHKNALNNELVLSHSERVKTLRADHRKTKRHNAVLKKHYRVQFRQ